MSNLLRPGQPLPELKALTASGAPTSVEAHLGSRVTLVSFLHGTWCPDCVSQLYRLQRRWRELAAAGVGAVTLVRDQPETLAAFLVSARPRLEYTVLADPSGAAYGCIGAGGHTLVLAVSADRTIQRVLHWADRRDPLDNTSLRQLLHEFADKPGAEHLPVAPPQ
jgi:peroxiredoxin